MEQKQKQSTENFIKDIRRKSRRVRRQTNVDFWL
jgi:hypothetical protein